MASIGYLSFVFQTTMDGSVLLHNGNLHRPRFISSSNLGSLKPVDGERLMGLSSKCEKVMINGCNRRKHWKSFCSRAMNKNAAAKGEGSNDESSSSSEDKIEATIEKSKKVLAMQKDLLEEIAERRKLVSSIKSSITSTEEDTLPYNENDNSFPGLGLASNGGSDSDGEHSNGALSGSYDASPAAVDTPVGVSGSSIEGVKKPGRSSPPEMVTSDMGAEKPGRSSSSEMVTSDSGVKKPGRSSPPETVTSNMDFQTQRKETSSETVQSRVVPSLISKTSESSGLQYKNEEGSTITSVKEATTQADGVPGEEKIKPPPLAGVNVMNIILVAAECAPWSKTGGLGDVAGALPKALARRGHRVMVVAPRYSNYAGLQETGVRKRYKVHGQDVEVTYFQSYIDGVDFVFIDSHMFHHFESNIYGGQREEILKRMVLFCKAAVEVPWHVPCGGVCYGDGNLVFIANDWHTALLPVYLKAYYRDNGLMIYARSVLVIHNIAHQGRGPVDDFKYVDLPEHYLDLFKLYDPVGGEHFNIFAAGLKTTDRIVTVSHGYAWELKTSEGGWGLHGIINDNHWKMRGIVNGIDTKEWNPQVDVHLTSDGYTNYSLETLQTGKPQCKRALQKELGLPIRDDVPVIGFIGRLDNQKGVDIIAEAIPWMVGEDVQLIMLGTGKPDLENLLRQFENQHRDKVRGWVGFSVKMAHRITAGADILLMPSRFEPCGLNQLYAMSYGTVPVVHAVGGLKDTVQPFQPYHEEGLGWTFGRADAGQLKHALGNCLYTYRDFKGSWEGLQRRGMMQDLSWDNAAQNYEEVLVAAKYQW